MALLQDIVVTAVSALLIQEDLGTQLVLIGSDRIMHGPLAFILAQIVPSGIDAGYGAFVYCLCVSKAKL